MIISTQFSGKQVKIDLDKGIDISIPIGNNEGVNAFFIPQAKIEPLKVGSFVGSVQAGGSANCENIFLNAHGNGTHTECVGHISLDRITIHDCLKSFHFFVQVQTVKPVEINNDHVITLASLPDEISSHCEAIILRTIPNTKNKLQHNYSGTNPCYLDPALTAHLRNIGIKHLLVDLPSVDREEDEGALLAHKAYWNYPESPCLDMTITELIYVPDSIPDGIYFLNLQIASLKSDASPSKPMLFHIQHP